MYTPSSFPRATVTYLNFEKKISYLLHYDSVFDAQPLKYSSKKNANPLSTKFYLSDLKTQFVPRSKHSPSRF